MNHSFLQVSVLEDVLEKIQIERQRLLQELIVKTNNPTIKKRRARMLSQLAEYEANVIKKIISFDSADSLDYFRRNYSTEISYIINRSG